MTLQDSGCVGEIVTGLAVIYAHVDAMPGNADPALDVSPAAGGRSGPAPDA